MDICLNDDKELKNIPRRGQGEGGGSCSALIPLNRTGRPFWPETLRVLLDRSLAFSGVMILSAQLLSQVRLSATPWTVAHQAPLSTGFSRQEYWSGLPCPPPGDLPDPGNVKENHMSTNKPPVRRVTLSFSPGYWPNSCRRWLRSPIDPREQLSHEMEGLRV